MKGLYEFFLLFSSLSERSPRETKLHYAFKIYDFDQVAGIAILGPWGAEEECQGLKVQSAFLLHQDNFIGISDIEQAVKLLTQVFVFELFFKDQRLIFRVSFQQKRSKRLWERFCRHFIYNKSSQQLCRLNFFCQVLEEGDIDDDKKLSSNEFTHVINKAPDFLTTFNIRI